MPGTQVSLRRMSPRRAREPRAVETRERFLGARIASRAAPLAPRGVGQILDHALDVFTERFAICVAIGTCLMLPLQLGTEIVVRSNLDAGVQAVLLMLVGLSGAPVQFVTSAFVCAVVGGEMMGARITAADALRLALRRTPGIFVIALMTGAAALVLICPCGFTTYLGYWLFAVVPAVYVLEDKGLGTAIGRGLKLVWGWSSFGRWLGWYVVATCVVLPLSSLSTLRTNELTRGFVLEHAPLLVGPAGFFFAVVEALLLGVALAYPAVLMVVFYVDLRVRREGLDLERQLVRLEARRGGSPA